MSQEEYPLYPELSPAAAEEAQRLLDGFKSQLRTICDEVLGQLYCDVTMYIESDGWSNYRNQMMDGFRNYGNRKIQDAHAFATIRKSILDNHREEIIADLNQDMVKEIASLKEHIRFMEENQHRC